MHWPHGKWMKSITGKYKSTILHMLLFPWLFKNEKLTIIEGIRVMKSSEVRCQIISGSLKNGS